MIDREIPGRTQFTNNCSALAGRADLWDGGVRHLVGLPKGYHTTSRGQSLTALAGGCVEGCTRDAARSGCTRPTG
ncbi:hypothetical protein ACFQE5_06250 [Pseudonocardia hispaniensis]|uniref:Uncharacterized protein n=1 Tax=Pseudonocardia hispaniensis TaxID=904933 RepID=A0ABW1IZI2_9PSEU